MYFVNNSQADEEIAKMNARDIQYVIKSKCTSVRNAFMLIIHAQDTILFLLTLSVSGILKASLSISTFSFYFLEGYIIYLRHKYCVH